MQQYWSRAMTRIFSKYLGWDWRILPLLGFIGSIASALFWPDMQLWGRLLIGYIALIILFICGVLATHDIWKEDTTKLPIINEQKGDIHRFIHSRYSNLCLRGNQVNLEVEWFNGTVFELEFQQTIANININGLDSGEISSIKEASCWHGRSCIYSVTLTDNTLVKLAKDAISSNKPIQLNATLHTKTRVIYEPDNRPESSHEFDAQCLINNIMVIPTKVG